MNLAQMVGVVIVSVGMTVTAVASPPATGAGGREYTVAHAQQLFGVSPNPASKLVMLFAASGSESEELNSGVPVVVDLETLTSRRLTDLETLQVDSNVVWSKDGRYVLFETTEGVRSFDTHSGSQKSVVSGATHGIAVSPAESRLAFWRVGKSSWELVVQDAQTSAQIRKWTIPFLYGGEASGFELVFGSEDTLYARTFDEHGATPLKRFDVTTGKTHRIEHDCLAVASAQKVIYYIASVGQKHTLKKITEDGEPEAIAPAVGYDDLRRSGSGRWLAVAGGGHSAILDTSSDRIFENSSCMAVTALSDDTKLYVYKNRLSSDIATCNRSRTNHR